MGLGLSLRSSWFCTALDSKDPPAKYRGLLQKVLCKQGGTSLAWMKCRLLTHITELGASVAWQGRQEQKVFALSASLPKSPFANAGALGSSSQQVSGASAINCSVTIPSLRSSGPRASAATSCRGLGRQPRAPQFLRLWAPKTSFVPGWSLLSLVSCCSGPCAWKSLTDVWVFHSEWSFQMSTKIKPRPGYEFSRSAWELFTFTNTTRPAGESSVRIPWLRLSF